MSIVVSCILHTRPGSGQGVFARPPPIGSSPECERTRDGMTVFQQRTRADEDQKAVFRDVGVMATPVDLDATQESPTGAGDSQGMR